MLEAEDNFEDHQTSNISAKSSRKKVKRVAVCPCCQLECNLEKTIGKKGIFVAICAHSSIAQQLQSEHVGDAFQSKCFAVCQSCKHYSEEAIIFAEKEFNGEVELFSTMMGQIKKTRGTILQSPLYCGEGRTLVCVPHAK